VESEQQSGSEPQSGIADALTRLEARAESAAAGWRLLLYVFIFIPLAIVICAVIGFGLDTAQLHSALSLSLFLAFTAIWYSQSLRRELRRRLAGSDLAQRIAAAELPAEALLQATVWLWRGTLPRGNGLLDTLTRVAGNLDWYLSSAERRKKGLPERRLFRLSWLVLPLSLLLSLMVLIPTVKVLWTLRGLSMSPAGWRLGYMLLGPLLPLLPLPFIYYRRQVWTQELLRYLRGEYEAK